jgi:nickel/cobalt transporter (NicO) family protein
MTSELTALLLTAGSLGFVHTLIGPDHYIPFIAMSQARRWTRRKTLFITLLCGLGHVLSSVVIGLVGIGLGLAVARLEGIEATRGDIAAWLMIGFGLVYALWGIQRALRRKPHTHAHHHPHGGHEHGHAHDYEHAHVHNEDPAAAASQPKANITPWVLFTIFIFGPCEPLIPILMYPAARMGAGSVVLVTAAFAVATIGTMLTIVGLGSAGLRIARFGGLERWMHATAGAMIFLCGFAIKFMGL